MPVRSSTSSVLRWPDRPAVDRAVRAWAAAEGPKHRELERLGYFGSYARGDWGPGSDLDLIAIVGETRTPFERRALDWNLEPLPVGADLLVYTVEEWRGLVEHGGRFARTIEAEAVWVFVSLPG